jgi:hypothetical protein
VEINRLCTWILGKLDMRSFPIIPADKHALEVHGVSNVAEAERDCASLWNQSVKIGLLNLASNRAMSKLTSL